MIIQIIIHIFMGDLTTSSVGDPFFKLFLYVFLSFSGVFFGIRQWPSRESCYIQSSKQPPLKGRSTPKTGGGCDVFNKTAFIKPFELLNIVELISGPLRTCNA